MDISDNITKIILGLVALLAVGLVIKVTVKKKSKSMDNSKNLKDVSAGGDIVLGDKKTNVNE